MRSFIELTVGEGIQVHNTRIVLAFKSGRTARLQVDTDVPVSRITTSEDTKSGGRLGRGIPALDPAA